MKTFLSQLLIVIIIVACNDNSTETTPDPIRYIFETSDVTEYGGSNGKIDITILSAGDPYSFYWSNGETSEDLINIPAGIYILTITDQAEQTATDTFVISQPNRIEQITTGSSDDFYPKWSPDGSKIIFSSNRQGIYDLFTMNVDGSDIQRVHGNGATLPDWSPAGNDVLFVKDYEVWKLNLGNQSEEKLTSDHGVIDYATWGHDGSYILFASRAEDLFYLWKLELSSNEYTLLYSHRLLLANPISSPDGEFFAYTSTEHVNPDIWIRAFGDSDGTPLSDDGPSDYEPVWSPDGQEIIFSSRRGTIFQLWKIIVSTGEINQITDLDVEVRNPSWSRDGSKLAFAAGDAVNRKIYVLYFEE